MFAYYEDYSQCQNSAMNTPVSLYADELSAKRNNAIEQIKCVLPAFNQRNGNDDGIRRGIFVLRRLLNQWRLSELFLNQF